MAGPEPEETGESAGACLVAHRGEGQQVAVDGPPDQDAGPAGRPVPGSFVAPGVAVGVLPSTYAAYNKAANDSRSKTQISWFSWYTDYPAPSDMINPLLTCQAFVPDSVTNLNAAEFCNRQVDAQIRQALALQARAPNAASGLWARIDREIVGQAPWVPIYNPRFTVLLSPRVGNYQFDPTYWLLIDQLWVR